MAIKTKTGTSSRVCPHCGARYSRAWRHPWCWYCYKEYAPAGNVTTGAAWIRSQSQLLENGGKPGSDSFPCSDTLAM